MGKRWDWAGDWSFLEWMAELIGVRVGLVASEEELRKVIVRNDHLLPDNASQKIAFELLGRSALESFGLDDAMHALKRPIVLGIQDRVGDYTLAVSALAFVMGRVFRPVDEEDFVRLGAKAAFVSIPLVHVDPMRVSEIIAEAAKQHGKLKAEAVAVALDELAFRVARNVIFSQVISTRYVAVFEVGEDQGGVGDVADSVWARGDVLQYPPTLAQEGEAAFTDASH